MNRLTGLTLLVLLPGLILADDLRADESAAAAEVSFNRDVRPILASKCFACHGPDEDHREADLRLDQRDDAIESGAIEPGDADESELVRRIFSSDPDETMPPSHAENPLDKNQRETLRRWVDSGAEYQQHWAFVPPARPEIPSNDDKDAWSRNPIDSFVLQRLAQENLQPAEQADRYTLVRRLYLDLVGLPPTPAEADAFVESNDPAAYEQLVDALLASPRYGEHWARPWLDLARYSDTNGYEKDRERSIWPYRDWVIRALNDDMPFDRFTIEQLAGDMLPDPTPDQMIATGFHRNTMLNEEGGIDPLEYRFMATVDRVATTGTVWLGMTTGCAQCHTHKYDPITHVDYYRLMALLNNADEPDFSISIEETEAQRKQILAEIASLESKLAEKFPVSETVRKLSGNTDSPDDDRSNSLGSKYQEWISEARKSATKWKTIPPDSMKTNLPRLQLLDDNSLFATGDTTKRDVFELTFKITEQDLPVQAIRLEALPDERLPDGGPGLSYYEGRKGDFFLSELDASFDETLIEFSGASHTHSNPADKQPNSRADNVFDGDGSTGWRPGKRTGERLHLVMNLAKPIRAVGTLKVMMLFERHYVASLGRFRFSVTDRADAVASKLPEDIERLLLLEDKSEVQKQKLLRQFLLTTPLLKEECKPIDALREKLPKPTKTMVMSERPADHPRETFRHHRGEWLSPREKVTPGILEIFAEQTPEATRPTNRLELARWLVSDANPLAARVTVNRAWRSIFGAGLMRTSGDFGVQSEAPTHPELLDWLAVEFVDNGWSLKKLHKLIVMSATYRQSSETSEHLVQRDAENRLLARGARYRVHGETVRDTMLRASDMLSEKMYGPGVFPPQPNSVTALAYGDFEWEPSVGEDRYRRSIYTFSKRTASFAAFSVFDAPTGENCIARRNRSNTPLQALSLLNDEMYLEMARGLAEKVMAETTEAVDAETVTLLFRRVLTRPPTESELSSLVKFKNDQLNRFTRQELSPVEVTGSEQATADFAAWTMVARVIMNLDESITRQ